MAYEIPNFYVGVLPADVDMSLESSWQFSGVCVGPAQNVIGTGTGGAALVSPSTVSTPILGVLQNNPIAGEAGQVMEHGVSKAILGATVTIGAILKVTTAGAFVPATTGTYGVAQALESGVV